MNASFLKTFLKKLTENYKNYIQSIRFKNRRVLPSSLQQNDNWFHLFEFQYFQPTLSISCSKNTCPTSYNALIAINKRHSPTCPA